MTRAAAPARAWPPTLAALALLLALVLVLYRDTAFAMVAIWARSDTFAHAFTVPPIVAWLVWRKRDELAARLPRANVWLLLPIALAGLGWLLGDLAASNALAQFAFTALLVLAVVAVLGPAASKVIAFPLAFLFFAVPIGEFVMPQMMQWTADFTVAALRLSGVPVYREGLQFVIPSGNWSVVEACSGVRYLIASTMVGVLFAYLNYRTLSRRLIFVGVAILVPVVANWLRAYMIVMLGHLSNNALAAGADHLIYGWVFFGIVIVVMFMIGMRWSEPPATPEPQAAVVRPRAAAARGPMAAVALAAAVLVALPPWALRGVELGEPAGAPVLVLPPELAGGWRMTPDTGHVWHPAFHGAAAEFNRDYAAGGESVGIYLGYYRRQDYAQKLVSSDNAFVVSSDKDWSLVEAGRRELSVDDRALTLRSARLRGGGALVRDNGARLRVWQIYWINGTLTSNDVWAKVRTAFDRLRGLGDDAAVIVLSTDDRGERGDARLETFVRANLPALTQALAATRAASATALAGAAVAAEPSR